jgi:hypothetical protein
MRLRFRPAHAALIVGLVLVLSGGAFAAGQYLITSIHQISPRVVRALRGHRGPRGLRGLRGPAGAPGKPGAAGKPGARGVRGVAGKPGTNGTPGANGQGPAIAVSNVTGLTTTSPTDVTPHTLATLTIPAAGSYTAQATVVAHVTGGSNEGLTHCTLTAHTTGASVTGDDVDGASASLQSSASVALGTATLPLLVTHTFSGPGTIALACEQSGLLGGGALFDWTQARIVATQVSTLTSSAVTS